MQYWYWFSNAQLKGNMAYSSFRTFNSSLLSTRSSCSDFSVTQKLTYIWSPHFYLVFFFPTPTFLPPQIIPTCLQFQDFLFSWFCTFCSLSWIFSVVFSYTWEACIYSSVIRLASPLRTPLCSTLHLLRTLSSSHYAAVVYIVSLVLN